MSKQQYLLVNQVTGPLFIDIANDFVSSGHKVTLMTGAIEKTATHLSGEVQVISYQKYNKTSFSRRFVSWSLFTIQVFFHLIFKKRYERILFVSNPPFSFFMAPLVRYLKGSPIYILIYDVYPEALVNFGFLREGSVLVKFWQFFNRWSFKSATRIITISQYMKKELSGYVNYQDKVIVIPNWVDSDRIVPVEKSENVFLRRQKLDDKFTVLYSGNLGLTHDLDSIVEAASLLREMEDIHFIIIGEGAKKEKLVQRADELALKNISFLSYQQEAIFPHSIASGDISIVTLAKGAGALSVPSKTYYMMAAGSALVVIAPEQSELTSMIRRYEMGYKIEPGDYQRLSSVIVEMYHNKALIQKYKSNALAAIKKYGPQNAHDYVSIITA